MIRLCLVCFLLLGSSGLLAYSALINLFQVEYVGANGPAWKATSTTDVQQYAVLRKPKIQPAFNMLASLEPTNQPRHEYIGQSTYHGLGNTFPQHLNVDPRAGQGHFQTTPGNTPGAVERSWGTIKSMFR